MVEVWQSALVECSVDKPGNNYVLTSLGKVHLDTMVDNPTNFLAFSEGKVNHVITIRVSAHQSFQYSKKIERIRSRLSNIHPASTQPPKWVALEPR